MQNITNKIDEYHESLSQEPRTYLGASIIGEKCERRLWYGFRWSVFEKFQGRMLRLFRRGHREEETVIADLKAISIQVKGMQEALDTGPHTGGHCDGIAVIDGIDHILEIKTMNKKSFDKNVVPEKHYAQMQTYMEASGIKKSLYVAVCKDDDRMHTEIINYDPKKSKEYIDKGQRVVFSERAPDRLSNDPTWWECKFCPAKAMCHKNDPTKELNCRTCALSTPERDGSWFCEKWQKTIPAEGQRKGCDHHVMHPDLVPWDIVDSDDPHAAAYMIDGKKIMNGGQYAHSKNLIADPDVRKVMDIFDA